MWALSFLRHRFRAKPEPIADRDWNAALRDCPYAAALSQNDQTRLRKLVAHFLAVKTFESAHDIEVTPTMKLRIALHACLPILNLGLASYDNFEGIVMYPGDFRVRRETVDEHGVWHEGLDELCGESLDRGPIVLSWNSLQSESGAHGQDLVIHECAHKLDFTTAVVSGTVGLPAGVSGEKWSREWLKAYRHFCREVERGAPTHIDPYAANDPAEFFAVLSETFFTVPHWIADDYPAVYELLARFYQQDPLATS